MSVIFNNVAKLFAEAGEKIKTDDPKELVSGAFNTLAIAANTVAQITAIDAMEDQKRTIDDFNFNIDDKVGLEFQKRNFNQKSILYIVARLVNYFYDLLISSSLNLTGLNNFPMLTQLCSLVSLEKRMTWIIDTLLSSELVNKLLIEIRKYIEDYMREKMDLILNFILGSLDNWLNDLSEDKKLEKDEKLEIDDLCKN